MVGRAALLCLALGVTGCALGPPTAKEGMALIDGAYIRGEGKVAVVGRIFSVHDASTGERLKISPYTNQVDVRPGSYTVEYICHLTTDRDVDAYIARNRHLVRRESVTLGVGQILYVRAEATAELGVSVGGPTIKRGWCQSELRIAQSK